ncbi:immunity protein Imm33 domain-containing protein [Schaalia meyeri]|uniref:immunity protein Imm33 domain-containing protein n=1 Tax=Schaalia meyeri TaxID=52773 RepID=UPI0020A8147C|nr:DUF2185 domain-containing protein [Schaalia meyeri]
MKSLPEPSANPADNGWRVLPDRDDDAYLANSNNLTVLDFNVISMFSVTLSPPASASTTCPPAPTFSSLSNPTVAAAGSTITPNARSPAGKGRAAQRRTRTHSTCLGALNPPRRTLERFLIPVG